MRITGKSGQSILEYTLVLGAVIAVIVLVLFTTIKPKIQSTYEKTGTALDKASDSLAQGIFGN